MSLFNVMIYGMGDSLNPCNLATLIIFAACLGWMRHRRVSVKAIGATFVILSFIAILVYISGGFMNILYSVSFFLAMRVVYVLMGCVFVVIGILHLIDWFKNYKDSHAKLILPFSDVGEKKPFPFFLAQMVMVVLAIVLNACATVWPSNKYVMFYANYLFVPGEFRNTFIMLIVYSVMLAAPMMLGIGWMSLTSPTGWVSRNLSRAKVMVSAFVLGLGVSLVYIFR